MPLYEYQCSECGNNFEVIQKFADPPVDKCPKCGGKVDKKLSAPAIQFKGQGWYITDYSRKGGESKPDSTKESKAGEAKTEGAKEPSKTEPSKETSKETPKKDSSPKEKASVG
ncbi:MAG TPA: FmdB family zinc ribbon protein [Acidobacteriota bacterium]|jgi:putative FmdB family regulatory protein